MVLSKEPFKACVVTVVVFVQLLVQIAQSRPLGSSGGLLGRVAADGERLYLFGWCRVMALSLPFGSLCFPHPLFPFHVYFFTFWERFSGVLFAKTRPRPWHLGAGGDGRVLGNILFGKVILMVFFGTFFGDVFGEVPFLSLSRPFPVPFPPPPVSTHTEQMQLQVMHAFVWPAVGLKTAMSRKHAWASLLHGGSLHDVGVRGVPVNVRHGGKRTCSAQKEMDGQEQEHEHIYKTLMIIKIMMRFIVPMNIYIFRGMLGHPFARFFA